MKEVTITHDAEFTFIDTFEDCEIEWIMKNKERYIKLLESRIKEKIGDVDDLHISNLKLFIRDEAEVPDV